MVLAIDRIQNDTQLRDHWVRRGFAYIIDEIIIMVVITVMILLATMIMVGSIIGGGLSGSPTGAVAGVFGGIAFFFVILALTFVFTIVYWIYFDANGGTLGKKLLKLRVVSVSGDVDYRAAAVRNGSKIVGGIVVSMVTGNSLWGVVIVAAIVMLDVFIGLNREGGDPRQKYMDTMAGTYVVREDVEEHFQQASMAGHSGPAAPSSAPPPAAGMSGMSKEEKLRRLQDRVIMGDISEEAYNELKKNL